MVLLKLEPFSIRQPTNRCNSDFFFHPVLNCESLGFFSSMVNLNILAIGSLF